MHTIFIGIGSNINPEHNLISCANALRIAFPAIQFSSVYKTAARDREDQADFLNAVCTIETEDSLEIVHETLKEIEKDLGKNPPFEKGPRTIDLDILLLQEGDTFQEYDSEQITIPHPRMHERRFVLEPLCELTEDTMWHAKRMQTEDQSCTKIELEL